MRVRALAVAAALALIPAVVAAGDLTVGLRGEFPTFRGELTHGMRADFGGDEWRGRGHRRAHRDWRHGREFPVRRPHLDFRPDFDADMWPDDGSGWADRPGKADRHRRGVPRHAGRGGRSVRPVIWVRGDDWAESAGEAPTVIILYGSGRRRAADRVLVIGN